MKEGTRGTVVASCGAAEVRAAPGARVALPHRGPWRVVAASLPARVLLLRAQALVARAEHERNTNIIDIS